MKHDSPEVVSAGVDELIRQLHKDGVDAGRQQGEQLLAEARAEAARIVAAAREQADDMLQQAQQQTADYRKAAEEALQVAFRDLVLDMKGMLAHRFAANVERLVEQQVNQPELLGALIMQAVGRMEQQADVAASADVTVELPASVISLDDIRRDPESARSGAIADLAFALQGDLLREGVTFGQRTDGSGGIRLLLDGARVEVDMSEKAIADLLLQYLQPRFRAILDGIIR